MLLNRRLAPDVYLGVGPLVVEPDRGLRLGGPGPAADWLVKMRRLPADRMLDRRIAEKRVFPSVNINRSGTRKEELITDAGELAKIWILRKLLHPMDELAAIEFLLDKMKDTKTNSEFFEAMKR